MSGTGGYNWTKWDTKGAGGGNVSLALCCSTDNS